MPAPAARRTDRSRGTRGTTLCDVRSLPWPPFEQACRSRLYRGRSLMRTSGHSKLTPPRPPSGGRRLRPHTPGTAPKPTLLALDRLYPVEPPAAAEALRANNRGGHQDRPASVALPSGRIRHPAPTPSPGPRTRPVARWMHGSGKTFRSASRVLPASAIEGTPSLVQALRVMVWSPTRETVLFVRHQYFTP